MPHDVSLIATIAAAFGLALILGLLAMKLRLPPLVGYLLAGVVVSPATPGYVADVGLAGQLAEIGVMLLMFGVGLHFSLDDLMAVRRIAVPGAIVQIVVATLLGAGAAMLWGWSGGAAIVFGLCLSVASTVVLLRALEARGLLKSEQGRIAVGWLVVEDLVMVLVLVLLPALSGLLGAPASGTTEAAAAGGSAALWSAIGLTLAKVAAFVVLMLVVGRRLLPRLLWWVARTGSQELFTLGVVATAIGVAFGAAKLFDVSFALGAFFAGMMMRESEFSHRAADETLPLRDAFAVLFFVSVGMLFDPAVLWTEPLRVLSVVLVILVGKTVAAVALVLMLRYSLGTALTVGASLAQIGEFSFILAALGVSLKILPPDGRDLILAGSLLSIIANPFLFSWLDRWQKKQDALAPVPAEPEVPPGPSLDVTDHAIIIGYGRVGSELARVLRDRGVPLIVIDDNSDHVARAHDAGIPAIRGSAAADRVLAEAHPERAKIAVLAIPQPLEAGEALAKLRAINPALTLLARAHSEGEVKHLLEHGADGAVLAERELAFSLAEMVMSTPPYRPQRIPG